MTDVTAGTVGGEVALTDEDFELMKTAGSSATDFKKEDLLIPFMVIVQATSAFVVRNDPEFIDAARPGDIIDTLTRDPAQRVAFVPCKYEVTYTEWKPNRGALVKSWGTDASRYDSCGDDFGTRKTPEGNDIVPSATYYGLKIFPDGATMPVTVNMSGTQYKKSRRLNTLINMLEVKLPDGSKINPPMYSRVYAMDTVPESNDQGTWHGWRIEPGSMILRVPGGRAVFDKAKVLRDQIEDGTARAQPVPASMSRTIDTDGAATPSRANPDDNIPF
jgi:hypothetical protein